jgi:heat shock protein HslJ
MDDQEPGSPSGTETLSPHEAGPEPAAPMGRWFWAVMTLIGVLILLIIYAQVQGVTRPVSVNLTGSCWILTYYSDTDGMMVPAVGGAEVNLSFGPAGTTTLGGYAGCAWYSYSYNRANTTALHLANGTASVEFCTNPGVMQAESAYLRDLENTSSVRFRSGQLTLYDASGKSLLIFSQSGS